MRDEPEWIGGFLSALAKVVGAGAILLVLGLVRSADDLGRAIARTGSHAVPFESAADDGLRATRPSIDDFRARESEISAQFEPTSELVVAAERESAEQPPSLAGRAGDFASEVAEEAAGEIFEQGAEEAVSEALSKDDQGEQREQSLNSGAP